MCRYCPPSAIVCIEPADERPVRCARCEEEFGAELFATAEMAELTAGIDEGDELCAGCYRTLGEEVAAEAAKVECGLCGRAEHPSNIDHVDTFAGAASVAVCHACELGHRDAMDSIADAAREATIDRMEANFELSGPLPTEADWMPVGGDAA